jgi:hypothetical protein
MSSGQVNAIPHVEGFGLTSSNNFLKELAFFDLLYALICEGANKAAKTQKKRRMTL